MVRYNANGTLDTSFGAGGKVLTTINGVSSAWIKDLAVLSDGKILALGSKFIARYNPNGSLDTTFGSGGTGVTVPNLVTTGTLGMLSMVIQSDGGIVVGGQVVGGPNINLGLVRFTPGGVLDSSFAGTGVFVRDLGGDDMFTSLHIQDDGKILAAGLSYGINSTNHRAVVSRFRSDGTLDPGFGTGGLIVNTFGAGSSTFEDSALQPDGKLVAVGQGASAHNNTTDINFLVARYLGDPVAAPATAAPRLLTQSSNPTPQATESLVPVAPPADQALTLLATELLRSGRKSFRLSPTA